MMVPVYSGEFVNRNDELFKVVILKEEETAPETIGGLSFPDDDPITIEWNQTAKRDVVCGSTATIRLLSPGDRTYEGLYTITPGQIRCDIFREGVLYWRGTLDPEFYEEPYTDNEDYPVELTFSDFGIFERLKYDLTGMKSIKSILVEALERAQLFESVHEDWISTKFDAYTKLALSDISIASENFIDEDGEISSVKEVIEGLLQPLALRMIQTAGIIYVYDLNGIYAEAETKKIQWYSDDQVMGVDEVANNAVITFSPYAKADILNGECSFKEQYNKTDTNLTSETPSNGEYYTYYPDYAKDRLNGNLDYWNLSFTIHRGSKGEGLAATPYGGWFFIQPHLGAEEATGAVWGFRTGGHGDLGTGWPKLIGNYATVKSKTVVMQTHRSFIPYLSQDDASKFYIRLTVDMLCDPRYNPFTDANDNNESGNYSAVKDNWSFVYIPVTVTLYDAKGNALMYYDNSGIASKFTNGNRFFYETKGEWKTGGETYGACWLSYYDKDDRKHSTGVLGWKKNRQNIGLVGGGLFESFTKMEDGQYIPYPPMAGYIEIKVYCGVWPYSMRGIWIGLIKDYTFDLGGDSPEDRQPEIKNIRWLLYKAPIVEIVRAEICNDKVESDDVEYKGYINKSAKEDISIDTMCGTMKSLCPTARGVFRRTSSGEQIINLYRAGRTDQAERLLIGTLYSQYAQRKTKLSGTMMLGGGGLSLLKDGAQPSDKKFLVLSEVQDIGEGTSEIECVELRPDEYDAIEEIE